MKDFLLNKIATSWNKPKSIPAALLLAIVLYFTLVSIVGGLDGVTLNAEIYHGLAGFFLAAWAIYSVSCVYAYRLPRAPKGYWAVLFCIDAESDKLFAAAEKKLVSNFDASLARNSNIRFKALCVSKNRVSRYDLNRDSDCLQLLCRTGSVILVDVRYTTDDVDNSERFALKINYGVRHPQFNETAEKALAHDMEQLGSPLRERRFEKRETIDVFEFSTQALVFVCQYIIGFVLLLTGDGQNASELLHQARHTAERNAGKGFDTKRLIRVVDDRLFSAYLRSAHQHLVRFQEDHTAGHLNDAETALALADSIHSNTYSYNLLKAYILVMLHKDGAGARKCIERCKQSNLNQDWTYSDAFLCAYVGNSPGHVISKYNKAFKLSDENLVELADYIEVVCAQEPERLTLHLALGMIYSRMENNKLARYHLAVYIERVKVSNSKDKTKIENLIQSMECDIACDRNCGSCACFEVG